MGRVRGRKRARALVLSLLSASLLPGVPAAAEPPAPDDPLVISGVTLIDGTGAAGQRGMTVIVEGGRIARIGRTGRIALPSPARTINASGKFMIPGLWDMHTHWSRADYLPLYLANGVTGVRLMRGLPVHGQWRKAAADGQLLAPHLVIASPLVDGPAPVFPDSVIAGDAAGGRAAVAKVRADGADFVKVYSLLPRDAYFGLMDEARRRGMAVAGHVPRSITTGEASAAGQKSIEHLSGIAFACSRLQAELPADIARLEADAAKPGASYLTLLRRLEGKHYDAYDPKRCVALFARFRTNGTWQVPTLMVNRMAVRQAEPGFADPDRRFMPRVARSTNPADHPVYKHFSKADFARLAKNQAREMRIVGGMQRAGVGILAGTDVVPIGFSLHDELALLVEAGLTEMQALQAATRNPAAYLGQLDMAGTIEVGKRADLVLLDANPLADIRNTSRISAVVFGGKPMDRAALDAMLADVETLAARP
jgi:imidazolonepropionase-like amidohydrolase